MEVKYFSMFSGIRGFELGIRRANICRSNRNPEVKSKVTPIKSMEECQQSVGLLGNNADSNNRSQAICVGYSEIDKYAIQIYQKHFKGHTNYGDCTKIKWEDVPIFDLLVGGFPCQSFSIAGTRKGFRDTRGTLFFEIARCLREKQPRLVLLENVKGLLSHNKGSTYFTILSTLDELGYDCEWQVLNSKNFGVPQNRERVFIVGHLRGGRRPKVFPVGENSNKTIKQLNQPVHSNDRVYGINGMSPALNTMQGGNRQPFIKYRFNGEWKTMDIAPTFRQRAGQGEHLVNGIRRLTPVECERLQGFPDGWTAGVSDTQRYKCLGNAVTVNVIETIVSKL